jgi:hypothetical protein
VCPAPAGFGCARSGSGQIAQRSGHAARLRKKLAIREEEVGQHLRLGAFSDRNAYIAANLRGFERDQEMEIAADVGIDAPPVRPRILHPQGLADRHEF